MLGLLFVSGATLLEEVSLSVGKRETSRRRQSLYTMAFLNLAAGVVFFGLMALIRRGLFVFSLDSLPTFTIRAILEIAQLYATSQAIILADRSTFGYLRIGTIPLLLLADLILGYTFSLKQIIGIVIIVLTLLLIFLGRKFQKRASGYLIFATVNAVFTLSLFKYNITHYNSVVAEQLLIMIILILYAFIFAYFSVQKENPVKFLGRKFSLIQSISQGLGAILGSFAYSFGPASLILTGQRSSAIFWSILSGNLYFKERHLIFKLLFFLLLALGIILIIL